MCCSQVVDAGDAVRAELREHEQRLMEDEAARVDRTNRVELQVRSVPITHLS